MATQSITILRPYTTAAVAVTNGTGGSNLLTPDPKEIWQASAAGASIALDLGAPQLVDSAYLGATNLPAGSLVLVYASYLADRSDQVLICGARVPPAINATAPVNLALIGFPSAFPAGGPVQKFARYVDIQFQLVATAFLPQVGIALAAKSFRPFYGHEYGSGRGIIDTGSRERLIGGGFGLSAGARKKSFGFTLGDLTDAELPQLEALLTDRAEGLPVVILEAGDAEARRFNNFANTTVAADAYTDEQVTKSGGGTAWNASATSGSGIYGGCFVAWRAGQTNKNAMIGLTRTPTASANFTNIEAAGLIDSAAAFQLYDHGAFLATGGAYDQNTPLAVAQIGDELRMYLDGVVKWRLPCADREALWSAQVSVNEVGTVVRTLGFFPTGLIERSHYGLLDRIEKYERREIGATRWGVALEHWI